MMPVGASWGSAAVDEVVEALTRDPTNLRAAQLLAAVAFEVVPARAPAGEEREADRPMHRADVPPAIVPRMASLLYRAVQLGIDDPAVLRTCTSLLLDAGDAGTAHDCSMRALAHGSDSTWHLLRLTWLAVLQRDTTTAKWFFEGALRSAHDPRARAELGWHLESPCQPRNACAPVGLIDFRIPGVDKVEWLDIPDSAAGIWFAAKLRAAARGDTTKFWRGEQRGFTQAVSPITGAENWSALARHIVAHFTSLSYAGGTFRACEVFSLQTPPCWATLNPYDDAALEIIAQVDHLWNPATGDPMDLVPYTILGTDLALHDSAGQSTARVDLGFRRWGSAGSRDTTVRLVLALPPRATKRPAFTGYLAVSTVPGLDAWSLMATQTELRHGGAYQDAKAPLDAGPLVLSDLILGAASQGLSWEVGGRNIALAPQDVVTRTEPVELYYQVKSDAERSAVRTKVVVFPEGADRSTATPALQISFETPIRRGVNEVQRELSVARLASGHYRFEVVVDDPTMHLTSRRSVVMYVK